MTAKIGKARREAFVRALRQTGNQTLAAEAAKVSRAWVCLHRKRDAEFDAACRAAIGEARARFDPSTSSGQRKLGSGWEGGRKPPAGWGFLGGVELVVKGVGGSAVDLRSTSSRQAQDERKRNRRVQIARARLKQITPRVEQRFLAALAATCNVKAACAEAGISHGAVYAHRKRWPAFAALWDQAVEAGYRRIDSGLTANVIRLFDAGGPEPELAMPPLSVDDAIRIVRMHDRRRREAARRWDAGWRPG